MVYVTKFCVKDCVCVRVVSERWCVTKRCVKDGAWQKKKVQGPKMPCRDIKACHLQL